MPVFKFSLYECCYATLRGGGGTTGAIVSSGVIARRMGRYLADSSDIGSDAATMTINESTCRRCLRPVW